MNYESKRTSFADCGFRERHNGMEVIYRIDLHPEDFGDFVAVFRQDEDIYGVIVYIDQTGRPIIDPVAFRLTDHAETVTDAAELMVRKLTEWAEAGRPST